MLFVELYVLCRSDSTENDNVQGSGHNVGGSSTVAFGVSHLGIFWEKLYVSSSIFCSLVGTYSCLQFSNHKGV